MSHAQRSSEAPRILVGVAGWSYPDWEGIVYARGMPRRFHPLRLIASLFNVAEINASFYRTPAAKSAEGWVSQIADESAFRFTAKLHRSFTHERTAGDREVAEVHDFLAPLMESGRLSALLLQFPWSFRPDNPACAWLERLLETFERYPLAVEMRHSAWWKPWFFEFLSERSVSLVNIDQPALENNIPPDDVVTAPLAYVRFHGRNNAAWWAKTEAFPGERYSYLYSGNELDEWGDRISRMAQSAQSTIIVMNNHAHGQAVVNGIEIASLLRCAKGEIPRSLYERHGDRLARTGLDVERQGDVQPDFFG